VTHRRTKARCDTTSAEAHRDLLSLGAKTIEGTLKVSFSLTQAKKLEVKVVDAAQTRIVLF